MHLQNCEHPVRVYNKYIHEWMDVPCRKCNTCRKNHQSRWVAKLENERKCWKYCYMVYFDYNDYYLPKLFYNTSKTQLVLSDRNGNRHLPVDVSELVFSTDKDREYLDARLSHPLGLPVCSVYDIQLLKKRINKIIHDKSSKSYGNFRSFICAEYGPVTQRPHYHGILFFNSDWFSENIKNVLSSAWKFGHSNACFVEKNAISYVATYVNSFDNLPSFYKHKLLRPFYLFSKCPPLGSLYSKDEISLSSFLDCSPTRTVERDAGQTVSVVPVDECYKNRLYPKIVGYSDQPMSIRVGLYGLFGQKSWTFARWASLFVWLSKRYPEFRKKQFPPGCIFPKLSDVYYEILNRCNFFHDVIANNSYTYIDGFTEKQYTSLNTLYRFYTVSRRVCTQADVFGISVDEYVHIIDKFYSNVENFKLKCFYEFQECYSLAHNPQSLRLMYTNIHNYTDSVPDIEKCEDYKDMVSKSQYKYDNCCKTKDKNAYFSSKKFKDKKLKQIVSNYYGEKFNV